MNEPKGAVLPERDGARQAIVRLLESKGIDPNHVEYSPIEIEPIGAAFAVHYRGVVFVSLNEMVGAMHVEEETK